MKKVYTDILNNIYLKEEKMELQSCTSNIEWNVINVYPNVKYQKWYGFGGAFTESACYNICSLKKEKYENLLFDYFSKNSLNYTLGRIPIGSCDFSLNSYSYTLKHDKKNIIPVIKDALKYNKIKFMASPWSPPKEWKTNKSLINGGLLKKSNYQDYAKYLADFVIDYKKNNIKISYINVQNEPIATQIWESCLYLPNEEADFLENYLIPTMKKNNIKIDYFIFDHNKDCIYKRVNDTINKGLLNKIFGIAYHWYTGSHLQNLDLVHQYYPNCLLYHTESCCKYSEYNKIQWLKDAELIGLDILSDMNHYMNAYIDWNLVLDYDGGPNWASNNCKAPIILNSDKTDYIKTPIYYYIAHFSKYIKNGYRRIATSTYFLNIFAVAFTNDKEIVVVVINPNNHIINYNICIDNSYVNDELNKHSIVTYILKNNKKK